MSSSSPTSVLPQELQKQLEMFISWIIDVEKKEYHNDLVPFSQKAAEIQAKTQQSANELYNHFMRGQKALYEYCKLAEEQDPTTVAEAGFAVWEKALATVREKISDPEFSLFKMDQSKPLQEQLEIPWPFMNRAYQAANHLLDEKRFDEADAIYTFLCMLHPFVFEYWLGQACAQQELGKFEEALNSYIMSLLMKPDHPIVFFQMASCFNELGEKESCLNALEECIRCAKENKEYATVLEQARAIQQSLRSQKAA